MIWASSFQQTDHSNAVLMLCFISVVIVVSILFILDFFHFVKDDSLMVICW